MLTSDRQLQRGMIQTNLTQKKLGKARLANESPWFEIGSVSRSVSDLVSRPNDNSDAPLAAPSANCGNKVKRG